MVPEKERQLLEVLEAMRRSMKLAYAAGYMTGAMHKAPLSVVALEKAWKEYEKKALT